MMLEVAGGNSFSVVATTIDGKIVLGADDSNVIDVLRDVAARNAARAAVKEAARKAAKPPKP